MAKKNIKTLKIFLGLIFVFFLAYFLHLSLFGKNTGEIFPLESSVSQINHENTSTNANIEKEISLIFTGDIMLDRGVGLQIKKHSDWKWPFLKISDELSKANIVFGNLEGPISDKGVLSGSIYSFRDNPKAMEGLVYANFKILSIANNHAMDYGRQAMEDTLSRLKSAGIDPVGGGIDATQAKNPVIKEINKTKFAFLAYTDLCPLSWRATTDSSGINCVTENDLDNVKKEISDAKKISDIVIVSLHSGIEYSQTISQFQQDFARSAIDAGADLLIGHHPHVVQKSEQYKDKWIFYSLGNFVFDQDFSQETMQGLIVKVAINDKKISAVTPVKTRLNNFFQVEIATSTEPEEKPSATTTINQSQKISPQVLLSSLKPSQGDSVLISVNDFKNLNEISGTFNSKTINFFLSGGKIFGLIGIDAKMAPGNYKMTFIFPDNYKLEKTITVVKKNFPTTILAFTPELEDKGFNATSVPNLIVSDTAKLYAALATSSPASYFSKSFFYPLDKIIDVGAFGNIRQSGSTSLQHLGTDLEAATDTPVYAINDGVVKATLNLSDYGNTIVIDHGLGIFSMYLHLDQFKVVEGQKVARGQIIALSGNTGYSIAPHLHFSIKINGSSADPLKFIETANF
jgi:poly-gamma-glutamate capsule biosynthesis protein CapA/YwtB (metallophosphatase superfamily)